MRRVLLFRSDLLPGSETFIAAQAGALVRYEPWFAGMKRVRGGLAMDERRVLVLDRHRLPAGKVARRLYLRKGFAPKFLRHIESLGPSLLHAHFAVDACAALPVVARIRTPMIVTLHGYDVTSEDPALAVTRAGRVYLERRRELWRRARIFVCVSEWIRHRAIERGFPEEKLWVHPIGVDTDAFHPGAERAREPLVLFVGRLVEKKGCIHLLRAMRDVEVRMPGARLVIVGNGPLRGALEAEARGSLRRCEFAGAASPDIVRAWMRKATVVAVPSVVASNGDAEGLCLVACEAQAMGVPVAGFRAPGIEVVDGETGLLVAERDECGLANAMVELLRDEPLAARMGASGRARVKRLFDLTHQTALLEAKYDEVLSRQ